MDGTQVLVSGEWEITVQVTVRLECGQSPVETGPADLGYWCLLVSLPLGKVLSLQVFHW